MGLNRQQGLGFSGFSCDMTLNPEVVGGAGGELHMSLPEGSLYYTSAKALSPKLCLSTRWGLVGNERKIEYSPPLVDRMWLWVYYNKIPIYPISYLLTGDCICIRIL